MRGWAVGWCSIFFFFKQKTAYEMRISDWSSDVCSSDLIAAGSQHQQRLAVQRRAAEQVRHHVVIGRAAGGEDHRSWGEQEIGRASCRARVCKYVQISVVAVSLQKKEQ